jgi:D-beta-D-heptose 7-phosphate kinase/D-beta-D-heptose 1-phosphate adenosyltransferase
LLIGDTCIDNYIYGTVDRVSPEAPIPVLKMTGKQDFREGMSGNVRKNLEAFNCEVKHIRGNNSVKTRYIDIKSGYQLLRVDRDANQVPLEAVDTNDWYDAIVISDYDKGFITYDFVEKIRQSYIGPIFIDTKKTDLGRFDGCYVKINESEFSKATSLPNDCIVTLSSEGTRWNGKIYPTDKVEVHDVTGAGDVYLASLAVFYLFTGSIESAIPFANKLASISVQHQGVYTITKKDINSL